MIGKEKLFKKIEKVLDASKADQAEIIFLGDESGLTRYANSAIHQNVYEKNFKVFCRSIIGKKIGVAITNSLLPGDLQKTLNDSYEIARKQPESPDFAGLPGPAKYKTLNTFDEKTAKFSPANRAREVKKIIKAADKKKFNLAGAFSTGSSEIAVLNTNGIRSYQPVTQASINMIAMSESSSGYAAGISRHVEDIDFDALINRAVGKCDLSQNPRQIEPGDYEVILEPAAVASLLEWLNYIGFGAKSYHQKTSFLSGKKGRKITSDKITIRDDALDQYSIAFPFDMEGVPKKKVTFIDKGIVKDVVYNTSWAKKGRAKTTGHALTPDDAAYGPLALNLVVLPGKVKRAKMMEGVKKGILVTRFHYINGFIDTPNAVLTGMTRDGTFLIENGEIVGGIKNLRFTDAIMKAFKSTVAVSKETELIESWWNSVGCVKAPMIHLGSFKFTGKTDF